MCTQPAIVLIWGVTVGIHSLCHDHQTSAWQSASNRVQSFARSHPRWFGVASCVSDESAPGEPEPSKSPLAGFIAAAHYRGLWWDKELHQHSRPHTTPFSRGPCGSSEHTVSVLAWLFVPASHQKHIGPFPHAFAQHRLNPGALRVSSFEAASASLLFPCSAC